MRTEVGALAKRRGAGKVAWGELALMAPVVCKQNHGRGSSGGRCCRLTQLELALLVPWKRLCVQRLDWRPRAGARVALCAAKKLPRCRGGGVGLEPECQASDDCTAACFPVCHSMHVGGQGRLCSYGKHRSTTRERGGLGV